MKFDIVSAFPEFFSVLDVSLVGKARKKGIFDIGVHDLHQWSDDPYHGVDDTPSGGGAGMVMRADIWGKAIDALVAGKEATTDAEKIVLAIPTPSGIPLHQRTCENLAQHADHIVIACGRYEGIDARVAQYYRAQGVQVVEYSLGDYVLNGGEIAAIALVEAVGRLLPGMVGNPNSLNEESHGSDGLLEYPVYTRPRTWNGLDIPSVLESGDHEKIRQWRRARAIEKTLERRIDIVKGLDNSHFDSLDKRIFAQHGWVMHREYSHPVNVQVKKAVREDADRLSLLAARTFPDAAPTYLKREDIQAFIDEQLSRRAFEDYLSDSHYEILYAEYEDECVGYTMSIIPEADGVAGIDEGAPVSQLEGKRCGPLVELSKFYIDSSWRSSGLAALLWEKTREHISHRVCAFPHPYMWLGTNRANKRAQKAYKAMGFKKVGTRTFYVGEQINSDVVFAQEITMA